MNLSEWFEGDVHEIFSFILLNLNSLEIHSQSQDVTDTTIAVDFGNLNIEDNSEKPPKNAKSKRICTNKNNNKSTEGSPAITIEDKINQELSSDRDNLPAASTNSPVTKLLNNNFHQN